MSRHGPEWRHSQYRLTDWQMDKLLDIRPRGIVYTEDELRAWFIAQAPVMVAKGYKNLYRTVCNWWPNAKMEEVRRAVEDLTNRDYQDRWDGEDGPTEAVEAPVGRLRGTRA